MGAAKRAMRLLGVVQIRVTRETWNPLAGAALATFGVTKNGRRVPDQVGGAKLQQNRFALSTRRMLMTGFPIQP